MCVYLWFIVMGTFFPLDKHWAGAYRVSNTFQQSCEKSLALERFHLRPRYWNWQHTFGVKKSLQLERILSSARAYVGC